MQQGHNNNKLKQNQSSMQQRIQTTENQTKKKKNQTQTNTDNANNTHQQAQFANQQAVNKKELYIVFEFGFYYSSLHILSTMVYKVFDIRSNAETNLFGMTVLTISEYQ